MKSIVIAFTAALLSCLLCSAGFAEELLKTADGKEYVGWEIKDGFLTCHLESKSKKDATVTPTARRCPGGPELPSAMASYQGTVVTASKADQKLVVKDDSGAEHAFFVPASKQWAFTVARPGDQVLITANHDLGNRLEALKVPAVQ